MRASPAMAPSRRARSAFRQLRAFLDEAGFGEARRRRMAGDASTRIFERLMLGDRTTVLMNSPRRPDGPPVRDGKPYSAIAHLAEDVVPFVAVAAGLRERGLSAPAILHADLDRGLLIIEDLGDERIVEGDPPAPIEERYEAAIDLLVALHRRKLPETAAGRRRSSIIACRATTWRRF